jgi:hypothetical protein
METCDCIAKLATEFPAVKRNCKPREYWNKLAIRHGIKRSALVKPEAKQEVKPEVKPVQVEMEIKINNPSITIPDTIIFGGRHYPILAIRDFRARLAENLSFRAATEMICKAYPEIGKISDSSLGGFFRLRLGLTSRTDIITIPDEKFEELLRQQLCNGMVCLLYEKKWRESAIAEKVVEMFPDLEAPSLEMIKQLVSHRRTKVQYKKRLKSKEVVENTQHCDSFPSGSASAPSNKYFIQLTGPKIKYNDELTESAAKSLLQSLLTTN